ncbi:MAG: hypothetical protein Q8P26_04380 [Candidatus Levybacteria bacterium]|nr:hypothetical protein [Candidatus Levybacteria bacterium]
MKIIKKNHVEYLVSFLFLAALITFAYLKSIQSEHPKLLTQTIFYIQSNKTYHGMPEEERNLPVQSGFGRMLMLWYDNTEDFPACMFEGVFLHDLIAQGYRECEGRGFGYFRNYPKLLSFLESSNIAPKQVIGYSWDDNTQKLMDISGKTSQRIKSDISLRQRSSFNTYE